MATTGDGAVQRDHTSELQFLVDWAPSLIHTSRPDGYLDFFNQTWLTYVGQSFEELKGWKWTAFIHPDDVEGIVEKWRLSLASGEPFLHEARVLRADGEYRWMLHHKVAARDRRGQIVKWYGSSIDIEERKRTEAKLQKSEAYLSEGQRLSHTGSFGWKVSSGEIFWSDETFRIFECDPKTKPTLEFVLTRIHPDDRETVQQQIDRATRDGGGFDLEHRLQLPDGSVKYVRVTAPASRDRAGNFEFVGAVTDITEQKLAEKSVRESDAHRAQAELYLAEGQRLAHTGSWAFDAAGFQYWSPELFRIYGLDPSGKPPAVEEYLDLVHPEDREFMEQGIQKMLADHRQFDFTKRIVRPDGKTRFIRCVGIPRTQGETFLGFVGTGMDVTEQAQLTEELRRSEAFLLEAQRLSRTGSWRHDLQSGIVTASPELLKVYGVEPGEDYSSVEFWFNRIHPEDRKRVQTIFERSEIQKTNYEADYRILLPDGSIKYQHSFGHPVLNESGQFVEFVGTAMDVTEQHLDKVALKIAFDEIKKSEDDLLEAQRLSHMGSWRHDVLTGNVTISPEVHRIFDIRSGEDASTAGFFFGRIHPVDQSIEAQNYERANLEKTDFKSDYRIVLPDGSIRHVHNVGHPVLNESGDIREFVGTVIDITERKTAEEKIRRLVEADILGIFIANVEGEIVEANQAFLQMLQYDRQDFVSGRLRWTDLTPAEFRERDGSALTEALATGVFQPFEKEFFRKDGSRVPVLIGGALFQSENEGVVFVLDLSEQKRAEEALRRSESYLAEAQRLSQTGSWAWNPASDITYWSEECYRLLGFEPLGPPPPFETVIQRIHPDDQAFCRERIEKGILDKLDFELDYRIIHPDKRVRDIHCVCHPALDRSGDLVELVGTVIDITMRKAAEEKIRQQEMEFRQILDLVPQHVAVYGPNRERLYANRVMLDYLGFNLEEWRHRPIFGAALHPDDWERATSQFDGAVSSGTGFELELRLREGHGNYRWFLARCTSVCDDKGQIMRWYLACTDIDDRKRAEQKLQQENVALREEIDKASMFEEIVGTSRSLKSVLSQIAKVAPTDSTVLITGETGTGKELIARAIHRRSQRSGRPFVSVNCAALAPTLVSSELFGHEKGAFTGATHRRLGRFEMAEGGTIFLDEVGELLPDTQAALLRVLQEREFERVGGGQPIHIDVRVIAATNRDLNTAVANGTFRQDLLYRLNVFPIEMPPLRERKDDILILVEYFVQRYANRAGRSIRSIDKKTLDLLQSYDWPGNIRELQNVIERSIILSSADVFSVDELWLSRRTSPRWARPDASPAPNVEPRSERETIEAALAETRGRISGPSGAAAKLRIPPSTLETRIKALKINKQQFKFG